jgi:MscS family membrane protein
VRVGEFCRFGETLGTVEEIGLRSTRIRTLERSVVTVPNAEFSKMELENLNLRDRMLLRTTIGLRYETTAEQLRGIVGELHDLLQAHPKVLKDPLWVRFAAFGAYSLDIELFAYVGTPDRREFIAIREELFLRIMDLVEAAGSGFAFPSQTHYLAQDRAPGGAPAQAAPAIVAAWRAPDLPPPASDPRSAEAVASGERAALKR